MRTRQSALVVCAVLAFSSYVASANAQSGPAANASEAVKAEASAHFTRGAELFQDGLYRAALVELKRAYETAPNHRVLYNIGLTHVALGEFVQAARAYENYLVQGGAAVPEARRAEIEAELVQLRRHVGALTIQVNRAGATVLVDDEEVGKAPLKQSVPVNVGRHRISARTDDGSTTSAEVDVAGGDQQEVVLELVTRKAEPVAGDMLAPEHVLAKRTKWGIGILSSGGALAATGVGLSISAMLARDDYNKQLDTVPGDPDAIETARDQLWRTSLAADVMYGAALLVGAGGLVLLLTKPRHERTPDKEGLDVRVGLTPNAVVARGRF
jgi:tetratricopeptide (TPR) repeat protein